MVIDTFVEMDRTMKVVWLLPINKPTTIEHLKNSSCCHRHKMNLISNFNQKHNFLLLFKNYLTIYLRDILKVSSNLISIYLIDTKVIIRYLMNVVIRIPSLAIARALSLWYLICVVKVFLTNIINYNLLSDYDPYQWSESLLYLWCVNNSY